MNKQIKFSHHYPKLHQQKTAELLAVKVTTKDRLSKEMLEYDTYWCEPNDGDKGYYELPPGKLLVLIFYGDKGIPFTTIRRQTVEKEIYYRGCIGAWFDILRS